MAEEQQQHEGFSPDEATAQRRPALPLWLFNALALIVHFGLRVPYRLLKKLLNWGMKTAVLAAVLLLIIVQMESVRSLLSGYIRDIVNENIAGELYFSNFSGNPLTGLTLYDCVLRHERDTALIANSITLRYDLLPLILNKTIVAEYLEIENADVRLHWDPAGTLVFEKIFASDEEDDDEERGEFPFLISARNITIINSRLTFDNEQGDRELLPGTINWDNARFENVNFAFSGSADINALDFSAHIKKASFREEYSGFEVRHLAALLLLDTTRVEIGRGRLLTNKSSLSIEGRVRNVNFFEELTDEIMAAAPLDVTFFADSLAAADIIAFSEGGAVLGGKVKVLADGAGTLRTLEVRRLLVDTDPDTQISLSGTVEHILDPDRLFIRVKGESTDIQYDDVKTVLPGVEIPDVRYLGGVRIDKLVFEGTPLNFFLDAGVSTSFGSIAIVGNLNAENKELEYHARLLTQRLNLAVPLRNREYKSSLTLAAEVQGSGTDLRSLCSRAVLFAGKSAFMGQEIDALHTNFRICKNGVIDIDTLNVHWKKEEERLVSIETAEGEFVEEQHLVPFVAKLAAAGQLDLSDRTTPRYSLRLHAENFDLDDVVPNVPETRITAFVEATGANFHPDSIEVLLCATADRFEVSGKEIPPFHLIAEMQRDREAGSRSIEIRSEPIDISVEGNFSIEQVASLAAQQGTSFAEYILSKVRKFNDPLYVAEPLPAEDFAAMMREDSLYASFHTRVDNIEPILAVFNVDLSLQVQAGGVVERYGTGSHIRIDSLLMRKFVFRNGEQEISTSDVAAAADLYFSQDTSRFFHPTGNFSFLTDSSVIIDGTAIETPRMAATINNDSTTLETSFSVSGIRLGIVGEMFLRGNAFPFRFPYFSLGFKDFEWKSEGESRGYLTDEGAFFERLTLRRGTREQIIANGLASPAKFENFVLQITDFDLNDVATLAEVEPLELLKGNLRSADITLNGKFETPDITLAAFADSVRYNDILIGNQEVRFDYDDFTVRGMSVIRTMRGDTALSLVVKTLPFDLSLAGIEQRLISGKPIDVRLVANDLSLATIAPFVPSVKNFTGVADASFGIEGTTPTDIRYVGQGEVKSCSFILESTNIFYSLTGKAASTNNIISLKEMRLANRRGDLPGGGADIEGTVRIDGFDIANIDLTIASDRLLVLSNASKAVSPKIYGDMIIATGREPLRFYGNFQEPFLRGDLNILRANLYYPEDRSVQRSQSLFCYETTKDSAGHTLVKGRNCGDEFYGNITSSLQNPYQQYDTSSVGKEFYGPVLPADFARPLVQNIINPNKSFADILDIDIRVAFGGTFFITMDLGPFEQLVAEVGQENIREPLRYRQLPKENKKQLFGGVRVREGSSYKFYRVFKATGVLTFPSGDISNPKLDLRAVLEAQRILDGNRLQPYRVTIDIAGTKNVPDVTISYTIDGVPPAAVEQSQVQTDAILLLVLGKTQDELQVGGAGGGSNFSERTIANQGISSVATSILSDMLQGTGVIRSAGVTFDETNDGSVADFSRARLQFTGEISSLGIVWNYGSSINDVGGSSSFTVDIPLGVLLEADALRNLVLTVSRTANVGTNFNRFQKDWEIRLGLNF